MTNIPADASRAEVAPVASAGDLVSARLRQLVPRLEVAVAGIRSGTDHAASPDGSEDPGRPRAADSSVHDLRVAVRELRSVLAAYRGVLPAGRTRVVAPELRWLSGELAPARDAEVLHERFELIVASCSDLDAGRPAVARFGHDVARSYADGLVRASAALDSPRFRDLVTSLHTLGHAAPVTTDTESPRRVTRSLIRIQVTRVVGTAEVALATHEPADRNRGLHKVRKQARRLRYTAEAALPVLGTPAQRLIRRAAGFQTILGTQHDSVVSAQALTLAARSEGPSQEDRLALGRLAAAELELAAAAETQFVEAWQRELPQLDRWVRHHPHRSAQPSVHDAG